MSETQQTTSASPAHYSRSGGVEPTSWVGWVLFAGIMMVILGAFQATMGLVALFDEGYFLVTRTGLVVSVDYNTWGWVHIVLGTVAFLAGLGVMAGQTWARVLGIIFAAVSAIVNIGFLAANPIWTIAIITLDVIVIYALAVHGREAGAYNT
jgi:hypothetical protein